MLQSLARASRVAHSLHGIQFLSSRNPIAVSSSTRCIPIILARGIADVPFRKQLKDKAKVRKASGPDIKGRLNQDLHNDWELTVGIEIHAQLNSPRKLFSAAPTAGDSEPNTRTALFDLSTPGSQPILQKAVLLPALRAAIALNCEIRRESSFDRKHYFYQDQPAGYQITQYYAPFAKDGHINLTSADGLQLAQGEELHIGIKQVQLEQDTAKTIQQPPDDMLLDFNRVGHPLIEIITLPHIHSPQVAAACVRKIQDILESVSAVTTGMELGGLRADVNVSVRRFADDGCHSYAGVQGLGQRTEIKNLSSLKAVEDAIIAERDRQIAVVENGGTIEGETRGWTIGSTETRKLRGKEGEVDYRYMPDPDIPPLLLSDRLVDHLKATLPMLPDEQTSHLTNELGISLKDAKTLVALDQGLRLDYLADVLGILEEYGHISGDVGRITSNWILHELGGLLSANTLAFGESPVSTRALADIIHHLTTKKINGQAAKSLLSLVFNGTNQSVEELIKKHNLEVVHVSLDEYEILATQLLEDNASKAQEIRNGKTGKLQWFVGQMMRQSKGKLDAVKAQKILRKLLKL